MTNLELVHSTTGGMMFRIILWVVGTALAVLALAEVDTTTPIVVGFGLAFWSGGLYYGGGSGWDRVRLWQLGRTDILPIAAMTLVWPLAALATGLADATERLQLRAPQHERHGRQLVVAGFFSIALWSWILGTGVILQSESFGFVVGIMAGPAMLAAAWWLFRRLQRNYAHFFTTRQINQVVVHLVGSLMLAVSGVAILIAVF